MYDLKELFYDYTESEAYRAYQPVSETRTETTETLRKMSTPECFANEIEPLITNDEVECELQGFIHGFRLAVDLFMRK